MLVFWRMIATLVSLYARGEFKLRIHWSVNLIVVSIVNLVRVGMMRVSQGGTNET